MKIAIAGFRHSHIYSVYNWAKTVPGVEIVAAWEPDASARAEAQKRGVVFTHDSFQQMILEKDIDIVAVGDYFGARAHEIASALRAGKHVLSDKPVCTTAAELEELEKASRESGKLLGCMLEMRYYPTTFAARDAIQRGVLGDIHNILFTGVHPVLLNERPEWYFEDGKHGGVINDIAIHGLDLIHILTGKRIERVLSARSWNAYAKGHPQFLDCAQFMLELEGGTGVLSDVSYCAPDACGYSTEQYSRYTLWGDNGCMEFYSIKDTVRVWLRDSTEPLELAYQGSLTNPLAALIDEIEGRKTVSCTQGLFASTRDAILLQAASDAYTQAVPHRSK